MWKLRKLRNAVDFWRTEESDWQVRWKKYSYMDGPWDLISIEGTPFARLALPTFVSVDAFILHRLWVVAVLISRRRRN